MSSPTASWVIGLRPWSSTNGWSVPRPTTPTSAAPIQFCLAHPLEGGPEALGPLKDWQVEWKFDGIRAQLNSSQGGVFYLVEGEDLITERFPEIKAVVDSLPDGTVLDGEILAWRAGKPMPFLELQNELGRKVLGKKIPPTSPLSWSSLNALRWGEDWRERTTHEKEGKLSPAS